MINTNIQITADGFTNINNVAHLIEMCDTLRGETDVHDVAISVIANNLSAFIYNSLNTCKKDETTGCAITIDELMSEADN